MYVPYKEHRRQALSNAVWSLVWQGSNLNENFQLPFVPDIVILGIYLSHRNEACCGLETWFSG